MARKIIVVAQRDGPGRETEIDVVFWLDVTAATRRPYYAGGESRVVGATQAELDAIAAGAIVERAVRLTRPPGATAAQIKAHAEARYAEEQAALDADTTYRLSGTFWDGATWTNVVNDA